MSSEGHRTLLVVTGAKNSNWKNHRGGSFRGRGGRGNWRGGRSNFRGNNSQGGQGYSGGNRQNIRGQNQPWDNRQKRDTPSKRLSELEIGVTQYISKHEGFLGIIKSRYSDFQVSEISDRGEIAKLTNPRPPSPPCNEAVVEDEDLLLNKYNLEILPMETWDSINTLAVSMKPSSEIVEIDVTGMSKEQRTKIHDAVKKAFGESIVGSTVNIDDKKLVKFQKYRKGVRIDNRVKWSWPGEYVYFIVHKENCDTMEAASKIAERLRLNIRPSMLGYAGTKDRRAKTSQWFSLRKVDPRKVHQAVKDMREIHVGNFTFKSHTLRLGMLSGNQFRIALRNVSAGGGAVDAACQQLQARGFINYYGLQRFGTRADTPTYQIGLKLLQGKLKEAIETILEEREGPTQEALRVYKQSGAAAALKVWPRRAPHAAIELRLLRALAVCPNDLLGALDKLARNTRLLYLHSYQSLIWNRAVSERIKRFGLSPAVGDIVPVDTKIEEVIEEVVIDDLEDESSDPPDKDEIADEDKIPGPTALESSIKQEKQKIPIRVLTEDDVKNERYSIFDIIMPLPGHVIEYPPNMREFYVELLAKDGLNLEMKNKFKSYTMSGAYRHVAVRPVGMSWQRVRYSDPRADLLLSDWDEIQGRRLDGILEDGKYQALLLTMTLPASCYATMALRELLKIDTACDNQALQNNYHKTEPKDEDDTIEDTKKVQLENNTQDTQKEVKLESKIEDTEKEVKLESKIEDTEKDVKVESKIEDTQKEVKIENKTEETEKEVNIKIKTEEDSKGEKRKLESEEEVEVKKLKQEVD